MISFYAIGVFFSILILLLGFFFFTREGNRRRRSEKLLRQQSDRERLVTQIAHQNFPKKFFLNNIIKLTL